MRYQRVSPDTLPPLGNGRKSNSRTTSDDDGSSGGYTGITTCTSSRSPFKTHDPLNLSGHHLGGGGGGGVPSSPQSENNHHHHHSRRLESSPSSSQNGTFGGGGGDVLLQWGHKKRSRISRTEIRASVQATQPINKVRRRAPPGLVADKLSTTTSTTAMPPPLPLPNSSATRTGKESGSGNGILPNRNLEDQSVVGKGSPSRNGGAAVSRSTAGKRSLPFSSGKDVKSNGSLLQHMSGIDSSPVQQPKQRQGGAAAKNTAAPVEKVNVEVFECPRIYLTLSRKEKEDDFLAMKGTKLPQRPKKRAKNIDKALQYCFPGMWLADLTRSRYEVREKKSVKKQQKRRGLKGMESLDSDSY